ncbi:MAG: hypothetical protein ACYTHJ_06645 [Planctomycetota bacterium]|jgi:hypothetical protein
MNKAAFILGCWLIGHTVTAGTPVTMKPIKTMPPKAGPRQLIQLTFNDDPLATYSNRIELQPFRPPAIVVRPPWGPGETSYAKIMVGVPVWIALRTVGGEAGSRHELRVDIDRDGDLAEELPRYIVIEDQLLGSGGASDFVIPFPAAAMGTSLQVPVTIRYSQALFWSGWTYSIGMALTGHAQVDGHTHEFVLIPNSASQLYDKHDGIFAQFVDRAFQPMLERPFNLDATQYRFTEFSLEAQTIILEPLPTTMLPSDNPVGSVVRSVPLRDHRNTSWSLAGNGSRPVLVFVDYYFDSSGEPQRTWWFNSECEAYYADWKAICESDDLQCVRIRAENRLTDDDDHEGRIEIVGPAQTKDAFVRHLNAVEHPILLIDETGRVAAATNGTRGPASILPKLAMLHDSSSE